jgi:hypothetical protein
LLLLHLKKGYLSKGFILSYYIGGFAFIGSVCFLSLSFLSLYERAAVRRDVDRLYAAMLFMQRKALIEGTPCMLFFDKKKGGYTADVFYRLTSGVRFGAAHGVCGPPSKADKPISDPIVWPSGVVTFYSDGTIAAGAVYLTDARGSCTYAITCDASETTHIRRYRYDNGKWQPLAPMHSSCKLECDHHITSGGMA